MERQLFKDIYDKKLAEGAIVNDRMEGFREDYLALHCLLRKYNIKSCFEIGCHVGFGTKIIKNALGNDSVVYSLDLPDEQFDVSKQHPINEGRTVGYQCDLPFTLLRGNSLTFDFSKYLCEAYWIDGEHTEYHVENEVVQILELSPKIVIFHDSDMKEVMQGIINGWCESNDGDDYDLYEVSDTRISYLLKVR